MRSFKKKVSFIAATLVAMFGVLSFAPALSSPALAGSKSEAQQGVNATGGAGGLTVPQLVGNVVDILSWIIGVVCVIMLILGGLSYITSQGDGGKISSAKNTIIYAIVGLVIVLFAQAIVMFVIDNSTAAGGVQAAVSLLGGYL